jgi:CRISPR/Cas system-associated exonuclease Cas4 (RecB family)
MEKKKKRQYDNDYFSVTQVLALLRKPQLEGWLKYHTAQDIDKMTKDALEIGTLVHECIENFVITGKATVALGGGETDNVSTLVVDSLKNALNGFISFQKTLSTKLKIVEHQLISDEHKVNGTIDCIGIDSDGNGVLLDWKTCSAKDGKKLPVYPEAKLQVAAYASLYNLIEGGKNGNPEIKKAIIVALSKDQQQYRAVELDEKEIKELFENIFLPLVQIKYALKENKEILDR